MDPTIPDGFTPHFKRSGLTDPWEPLYSCRRDGAVYLGFHAREAHANARGFVHGGLITSLADNAMGLSCGEAGAGAGLVTVSLSVDFLGSAQLGQWVEIRPRVLKVGGSMSFVDALILADGQPCARATATFRARTKRPRDAGGEGGDAA